MRPTVAPRPPLGTPAPSHSVAPRGRRRGPVGLALGAAVLVAALGGCGSADDTGLASDTAAPDPTTGTPTGTASPGEGGGGTATGEPSPTADPGVDPETGPAGALPLYFVGDSSQGVRLYREFQPATTTDPLLEAAQRLTAGSAEDPDYRTLLGAVAITAVTRTDDALVVTLGEDSQTVPDKGTSPDDAALAVQQLVYTLQGVAQERLPLRAELADGTPTDLLGQPTSTGVEAADPLTVLNLVSLTTPAEGAAADGDLAVSGVASSFEATVVLRLTDAAGTVVVDSFATAEGWIDRLYPFSTTLDLTGLDPGTYTLTAATDDPSAEEGPGPMTDTRTVVVD